MDSRTTFRVVVLRGGPWLASPAAGESNSISSCILPGMTVGGDSIAPSIGFDMCDISGVPNIFNDLGK